MEKANQRLKAIADFVKSRQYELYLQRSDREELERGLVGPDYRWKHTLRVTHWGKLIAEKEGADKELVMAACLLHDVAWFDVLKNDRDHGRAGGEISRPMLAPLGYSPEQVDNICGSVADHVDVDQPSTLEARIVADADNIDRFGAYRVLVWCQRNVNDFDQLVLDLTKRVVRLEGFLKENSMLTATGRQLFSSQLEFQLSFYRKIIEEFAQSFLPTL